MNARVFRDLIEVADRIDREIKQTYPSNGRRFWRTGLFQMAPSISLVQIMCPPGSWIACSEMLTPETLLDANGNLVDSAYRQSLLNMASGAIFGEMGYDLEKGVFRNIGPTLNTAVSADRAAQAQNVGRGAGWDAYANTSLRIYRRYG